MQPELILCIYQIDRSFFHRIEEKKKQKKNKENKNKYQIPISNCIDFMFKWQALNVIYSNR